MGSCGEEEGKKAKGIFLLRLSQDTAPPARMPTLKQEVDTGGRAGIPPPALASGLYTLPCLNTHLTHKSRLPSLLDKEELAPVCTASLYSKDHEVASGQHPEIGGQQQIL